MGINDKIFLPVFVFKTQILQKFAKTLFFIDIVDIVLVLLLFYWKKILQSLIVMCQLET